MIPKGAKTPLEIGDIVELTVAESHKAKNVLRLKVSDQIEVIIQELNQKFIGEIISIEDQISVSIKEKIATKISADQKPILIAAILKGDKTELVIEKATELGVSEIHIFIAERSVNRLDKSKFASRTTRWEKIAESAIKQSGQVSAPIIIIHPSLRELIQKTSLPEKKLFGIENLNKNLLTELLIKNEQTCIAIGPEGGFSDNEISLLETNHFKACSLGNSVLRAETASIISIGLINISLISDSNI
jgi:16S rRNA (uracil1498-N3)-methyltransferase